MRGWGLFVVGGDGGSLMGVALMGFLHGFLLSDPVSCGRPLY